ncbi:alpha/beta hydrolase [Marinobacter salarius]|uniref:alpha/beta fold hydrolase n=1 Tax=Marinobacter salarius TaxID=1420917 RepID=UPI00273AA14B|nr:alpha/beta hydrolase [Marinobacter salarius]MDP4533515.1 alpha/beta hydrolase [Marinobacter salarius]
MSLWLDMLGVEIKYVETPTFGSIRVAEAGKGNEKTIIFQHGLNGHLEAYAKNINALAHEFHIVAFDYVGHGLSDKNVDDYNPYVLAEQLKEIMDEMDLDKAHLSGESLGGWVSGIFSTIYPERVDRLILNTAGGVPVVSEKGKKDLQRLIELNKVNTDNTPTYSSVRDRLHWLMHENNHNLVNDELINLRLAIYLREDSRRVSPKLTQIVVKHDDYLIPLDKIQAETLFLWTKDNPIHDLETAKASCEKVKNATLYLMKGDSAHWPQYECPDEFNRVTSSFCKSGAL